MPRHAADPETAPVVAVVLAAGRGTRMASELPKVLHPVSGRPMLERVLATARAAGAGRILVVVGHEGEQVRSRFQEAGVEWVEQPRLLGTGDALSRVREAVDTPARLLVLSGDVPLVRPSTLDRLVDAAAGAFGALAVAELDDPGSLGRVVARQGRLERIVEAADATGREAELTTVNAGLYLLPAPAIFDYLDELRPHEVQQELYLTDALGAAAAAGQEIRLVELDDAAEAHGVNTRADLARVQALLWRRKAEELMSAGVTLLDPGSARVDPEVEVGADTILHPEVTLRCSTVIGKGVEIGPGCVLASCRLADGVRIEPYSVLEGAEVGAGCRIGPFARLRPGASIGPGAKVGNFVEIKNARLGEGVKVGHLSYLGDAEVGSGTNIGAGVVTCNYDGRAKHRTRIGRDAFIGSDTMLVAPVSVGERATTGAGSVISRDVPDGALAVERSRQRTVEGWSDRREGENAPPASGGRSRGSDRGGES